MARLVPLATLQGLCRQAASPNDSTVRTIVFLQQFFILSCSFERHTRVYSPTCVGMPFDPTICLNMCTESQYFAGKSRRRGRSSSELYR